MVAVDCRGERVQMKTIVNQPNDLEVPPARISETKAQNFDDESELSSDEDQSHSSEPEVPKQPNP